MKQSPVFQHLDSETRCVIDTRTAAHYLNRRPQTLRAWAKSPVSPLQPIRLLGRLVWPVAAIRNIVAGNSI